MSDPTPVEPADPEKSTSTILGPGSDEATVKMEFQSARCVWNDVEFAQGDRVTVDGNCYECSFGRWVTVDD